MLINEKVAYLKGIIDATSINAEKPEGKLLIEIVNALELIAFELSDQGDDIAELNDYVEELDDDLACLEEFCYDDVDCDCCDGDCNCCDFDDEDECADICDCEEEEAK